MAEYRNPDGTTTYVEKRGGAGRAIAIVLVAILVIVGILFATGFWSADVKGGALPKINVSAKGGDLPDVDVRSKKVVVGTTEQSVTVPKIETKKTTVDVPTVGVKDDK